MDKPNKSNEGSSRLQYKTNHYIGFALIFFIFVGINFVSHKRYFQKNLSLSTYTQITEQTKNIIQNIKEPVELINYISVQDDLTAALIFNDLDQLLKDYEYHSGGKISIKRVDPYLDYDLAREITEKFSINLQESVLIVKRGEQNTILPYRDLAEVTGGEAYSKTPPEVVTFSAEQEITSAIQSLSNPSKSVMYFITGHGEYDIDAELNQKLGLSKLATYIRRQNVEVKKVNLSEAGQIPEDAELIVIAGPQTPYLAHELEMIRSFILREDNQAGRLMLFLDPGTTTGLENLLSDYGVTYRDDLAITQVMILGQVRIMEDSIITSVARHPATEWMLGRQLNMGIGKSRSLQISPETEVARASAAIKLLTTPDSYWGETEMESEQLKPNDEVDARGPLTMAVLIDEGSLSGGQVNLEADRIVAVGGAEFLTNQSLQGNQLDFFLNVSNWMLNKENNLGISPKVPEAFNLTLDDRQRRILSSVIVLLIPSLSLAACLFVWFRRRK